MRSLILTPLVLMAAPAWSQEAPPPSLPAESDGEAGDDLEQHGSEILVIATRIRGQVDAPQPPVMTLDEADVASYGASSLGDLLAAISPQTGTGRGRGEGHPVILLNGQRIANFREMRSIPPEAIRRLEVLPEEVALRFGYPPNQRVINFILKDNFASVSAAGEYNVPTRGGFANRELEANLLRIDGPGRLNIEGKIIDESMLTEAERGVRQAQGADPDEARYRSLIDDSRELTLNATWSTGLGKDGADGSFSINGAVTRSDTRSLFGLDEAGDPLDRDSRANAFQGGVSLNKPLGDWQLSATADASYSDTRTDVDRPAGGAADRARTRDLALNSLATLAGQPFRLPAGAASLTAKAGFDFASTRNSDTRTGGAPLTLRRGDLLAGINLSLPLSSRKEGVLGAIGDVSVNLSAGMDHLSDFGTLTDWSAGATWAPTGKLGLQASYIVNEAAPALNQLGNPQLLAFNVPVYDFTRGEAVQVTIVNGGNPALKREKQRDIKLSANWELPVFRRSNLIVEYFRNRSSDVSAAFPLLTPAIEAAFPGRAIRDASGRLTAIDRRPVTFAQTTGSRLRWGFNLSGALGKEPAAGAERAGGGRGGSGGMAGAMGRMMGGGGGAGRWNLSVYHTYRLAEKVRIADAGPVLDLLGGDALAAGGVPRHAIELEGGAFHKGYGLRLNGKWNAPTRVRGSGVPGSSDLRFGSTFVLDTRLFVNFDRQASLVESMPLLKGAQIAFTIDNLFDSRQKVTDGADAVPLAYQYPYRDPRGRVIGIDIRKLF